MKAEAAGLCWRLAAPALLCSSLLLAQPALQSSSSLRVAPQSSDIVANPATLPRLGTVANEVLPVDTAFALTTVIEGGNDLLLSWTILPGYYLYRDKLELLDANGQPLAPALPQAEAITDEFFGATFIYENALAIRLPLAGLQSPTGRITLGVQYQGCAKDRYCYPPQQRTIDLTLPH